MKTGKAVLSAVLLSVCGCVTEEGASDVILLVTPSGYHVKSGEMVYYDIESWTVHESLVQLEISSFDAVNGECDIKTVPIGTEKYVDSFVYTAPEITTDSLVMEMRFAVTDNAGSRQRLVFPLKVIDSAVTLQELRSITMYSPASGKEDGFSLATRSPVNVASSPEEDVDFYIYGTEDGEPDALSSEWRSRTGLYICKVTGVDYPSLTYRRLSQVYESSTKNTSVKEVTVDDIILVGTGTEALAAIKIVARFDEEGTSDDRYLFNMKLPSGGQSD